MPITLLQTKFHLPPVRAGLVPRPRLQERLNQGLAGRLILVSAPAGFGKTTALQAWLAASQVPAAWLALDEGDNDPTRFLAYVLAALQTVAPRAGQAAQVLLQSPQAPPAESILTLLINDVAGQQEMLLALDDYHAITEDAVHRAITFLIDNLPSNLHLAIATRVDPPLPLARLRSRDELVEVRADDLRFTFAEVAAFLEGTAGLHLRPEDVAALEARTEGWIAGLRLAELSLRGRVDAGEFIHSFTGSHRHVLDFLVTEVFDRQSEQVQAFLLQTSVLARLCASLCEAVVGWESGSMLEYLERAEPVPGPPGPGAPVVSLSPPVRRVVANPPAAQPPRTGAHPARPSRAVVRAPRRHRRGHRAQPGRAGLAACRPAARGAHPRLHARAG